MSDHHHHHDHHDHNKDDPLPHYTLTTVTHEDGIVTSTLLVPVLLGNLWWTSRGAFYQFLLERIQHLSPEARTAVLNAPATSADWSAVEVDLLKIAKVTALLTAWLVGTNVLLTRLLPPYRRANAAITAATRFAPQTTLAATAVGGAVGVLECVLGGIKIASSPPPLSVHSVRVLTLWSLGTMSVCTVAGRFIGYAAAASWFGMDNMRGRGDKK